jgi:hypothetical protein
MPSAPAPAEPSFADWPQLIGESVLLRQRLNELDPDVNPYTIPHVGASEADLGAAEQAAGFVFDGLHRELLSYANGWEQFFTFTHLFSAAELGVSQRWQRASELLDVFYADGPAPEGMPGRSDVFCFCANPDEVEDLFVIWTSGPITEGGRPISWLAGEEVQRFPNMHEFLLSVNEYLRRDLAKLHS